MVRVVATGEESKEKLKSLGITPGKIQSSVRKRGERGDVHKEYYDEEGEVTRTEDYDPKTKTLTVMARQEEQAPVSERSLILGMHDPATRTSRLLTNYETLGYEATSGGMSVSPTSSATAPRKGVFVVQGRYGDNEAYSKIKVERRTETRMLQSSLDYDDPFTQRVMVSQARQQTFFQSEGMQNIRNVAMLSSYGLNAYSGNEWVRQTKENVAFGLMSWPIALAPAFISSGEKLAATGEGLSRSDSRQQTFVELGRAGKETLSTTMNPLTPEGASTYILAAGFAFLAPASKANPVTRFVMKKYSNKYVPSEKTGITFVEDYSVYRSLGELKGFEGRKVSTIHTTSGKLPFKQGEFVTEAQTAGAGKFRSEQSLYHFYKSAPKSATDTTVSSYTRVRIVTLEGRPAPKDYLVKTGDYAAVSESVRGYTRTTSEPYSYLAYAGIFGKNAKASGYKLVAIEPQISLLVGRDYISKTPNRMTGQSVKKINLWQGEQSGKTFVPAENIALATTEGQFITPSKYTGIAGYEGFQGSIIRQTGRESFTYYKQDIAPPTNPVARALWRVAGKRSQYYKFDIIEVETKPVTKATEAEAQLLTQKGAYAGEQYYSSIGTKYVRPTFRSSRASVTSPKSSGVMASSAAYSSAVDSSQSQAVSTTSFTGRTSSRPSTASYPVSTASFSSRVSRTNYSRTPSTAMSSITASSVGSSSKGLVYPAPDITRQGYNKPRRQGKSKGGKQKSSLVDWSPKYYASVEAAAFNIKGTPTKIGTISGLGIRPL